MSFACLPMQLEPVELHVVDALGQQDVPECFQDPAKACVIRGPNRKPLFRSWAFMKKCLTAKLPAFRSSSFESSHQAQPSWGTCYLRFIQMSLLNLPACSFLHLFHVFPEVYDVYLFPFLRGVRVICALWCT